MKPRNSNLFEAKGSTKCHIKIEINNNSNNDNNNNNNDNNNYNNNKLDVFTFRFS